MNKVLKYIQFDTNGNQMAIVCMSSQSVLEDANHLYIEINENIDENKIYKLNIETKELIDISLIIEFDKKKESLKKEIKEYKDSCKFIKYKDSEDSTEYIIDLSEINQFISDNIDVAYAAKEEKMDCSFKFYDRKTGDLILNIKSNYKTLEKSLDGVNLDAVKCFNLVKFDIQQKLLDKNWEECFKIVGNNDVKGEIDKLGVLENGEINYEEAIKQLQELKETYKNRFVPYLTISGGYLVESCSLLEN